MKHHRQLSRGVAKAHLKSDYVSYIRKISHIKQIVIIAALSICTAGLGQATGKDSQESLPPIEAHIPMPALQLETADGRKMSLPGELAKNSRFRVVAILGTWNQRSGEISQHLNDAKSMLQTKDVFIVGAFSHDTRTSLSQWTQKHQPQYPVGLADSNFIDALKNPRVPTIWLTNEKGHILQRLELPSNQEIERFFKSLKHWSDF